jgi:hypothetical protein
MDDRRKNAYRYLLYWAMLDIRPIAWLRWFHGWRVLNPFDWRWKFRMVRYAGSLADSLHNLALFSSIDFEGFDEDWFWKDLECVNTRYPDFAPGRYRGIFEERLKELQGEALHGDRPPSGSES